MTDQSASGDSHDEPRDQPGNPQYPTEQFPQYGQQQYPTQQYPQYGQPYGGQYGEEQYPQYSRYDQQPYYQHQYAQGGPHPYAPQPYQPGYQGYQQPYGYPVPPPPVRQGGTGRSLLIGLGAALAATALVLGGVALTSGSNSDSSIAQPNFPTQPLQPSQPNQPVNPGSGSNNGPGAVQRSGSASATQKVGVVTIVSTLKYDNALSAGTGMIMSSDGQVLTNNHVIRGATSIKATVQSTGKSYKATVVGTAPGSDVAVIKLKNASGLSKAKFAADAGDVRIGDNIVGVGNGGGTGSLKAAAGKVTALNQSITASDENGAQSEKLTGLIEVNARIISGDSGGPLYNAGGSIVGMNTAASVARSATATAYAIPIEDAMRIARQIESGVETADIRIGLPGFLGIKSSDAGGQGAQVALVIAGLPAEDAGITQGSIITSADGSRVTSATQLTKIMQAKNPGDRVKIDWTTQGGQTQSATVTLVAGPAD